MSNEINKPESFAELFEQSLAQQEMRQGEVITAEVVRVDYNFVVVNAGLKSEAYVPIEEFKDDRSEVTVPAGRLRFRPSKPSKTATATPSSAATRPKRLAAWMNLESALESGELRHRYRHGKVKGGLTVMTNGIRAFLPGSLVDTRPVRTRRRTKATRTNSRSSSSTASATTSWSRAAPSSKPTWAKNARSCSKRCRKVPRQGASSKNITDYGAFVDLGGIDGLLHITDLAWRRVRHPS